MARVTIREIETLKSPLPQSKADLLVLPMSQGDSSLHGEAGELFSPDSPVSALLTSGDFSGKLGEVRTSYGASSSFSRVMLVGLGPTDEINAERVRHGVAKAMREALELSVSSVVLALPEPAGVLTAATLVELATEAALLGTYKYDAPKAADAAEEKAVEHLFIQLPDGLGQSEGDQALRRGMYRALGTNLARDLGHAPANLMTPTDMAAKAEEMARRSGLEVKILEREDCELLGMGAFLGVTAGSAQPPKFIILEYDCGDPNAPTIGLVGKGITFDSGGISIKPAAKMDEMKYDMCGAAAVLGTMSVVKELEVPVNVVAAVAACENMPGGRATKPGDVHTSLSGKTIEILNTDAEGRLVLADALTYVARTYKPTAMINYATLTGAIIVALGHYGAGVFSNDDDVWQRLERAAASSGDRAWRLPIWEEMPEHLKTPFADLKNMGDGNAGGGSIIAGTFLREFVEGIPWAHIDIAGTAWWDKDRPHVPKGASGFGVRLSLDFLESFGK